MFWSMCPLAFFRCFLSNAGEGTENDPICQKWFAKLHSNYSKVSQKTCNTSLSSLS